MSLWQFNAVAGGFIKANTPDDGAISAAEADALAAGLDEPPVWQ